MLAVAADWRDGAVVRPWDAVLAEPMLAHYVVGWPAAGERGMVAEDEQGRPVGAAWWRLFPEQDPGYGFVSADCPELSVGVLDGHRGAGVGTALLRALIEQAGLDGLPGLSLSVEPDNPAARLYARLGFEVVGGSGGAQTMLLRLRDG